MASASCLFVLLFKLGKIRLLFTSEYILILLSILPSIYTLTYLYIHTISDVISPWDWLIKYIKINQMSLRMFGIICKRLKMYLYELTDSSFEYSCKSAGTFSSA